MSEIDLLCRLYGIRRFHGEAVLRQELGGTPGGLLAGGMAAPACENRVARRGLDADDARSLNRSAVNEQYGQRVPREAEDMRTVPVR